LFERLAEIKKRTLVRPEIHPAKVSWNFSEESAGNTLVLV